MQKCSPADGGITALYCKTTVKQKEIKKRLQKTRRRQSTKHEDVVTGETGTLTLPLLKSR